MAQLRNLASGTGLIVVLLVLNSKWSWTELNCRTSHRTEAHQLPRILVISAAPQFPDWSSQLAGLQNQTGVTGIPGAGDISFPGAGGIPSYGDLQNQTLPGGNIGTGFWDQLQNQTVPSPPDFGQIQGVIPTPAGNGGEWSDKLSELLSRNMASWTMWNKFKLLNQLQAFKSKNANNISITAFDSVPIRWLLQSPMQNWFECSEDHHPIYTSTVFVFVRSLYLAYIIYTNLT